MFKGVHAGKTPTKNRATCGLLVLLIALGRKASSRNLLEGGMDHLNISQSQAVENASVPFLTHIPHYVNENTIAPLS